ncbi:MAG: UDP-N-acetylmuramoyl-L-alanine--D-glutamate ligase [Chitinivibrionales bacterium]|nr:UDP-N-acetylmuramoyl-L-alanine--D-glutamate ligase [Chitinivibrionales bacterium]
MRTEREKKWLPEKIAVLGAGQSGIAVTRFLVEQGKQVFLSDACSAEKLHRILVSNDLVQVAREAGGHTEAILGAELIIVSPGVASDIPILQKARDRAIPIFSELELGFRQSDAPFCAVTGSSGKSTTVSLLGSAIAASGTPTIIAGNIGLALISVAPQIPPNGIVVAEVSSFQLELIDLFKPKVAAVVNLMKNHLDRYNSEEAYYDAKKNIIQNMTTDETLVLYAGDAKLMQWADSVKDRVRIAYFGNRMAGADSAWCEETTLYCSINGTLEKILDTRDMAIKGPHNHLNAAAAALMARLVGIDTEVISRGICTFSGLPHRLEFITEIQGVRYYNDSKSTTAESVAIAVLAFDSVVHLIAGGRDKGCDFASITPLLKNRRTAVYLIGEAAQRMYQEWKELPQVSCHASLSDACEAAARSAVAGEVVVLSPGCSSFDMFKNYEERGIVFKNIVFALKKR